MPARPLVLAPRKRPLGRSLVAVVLGCGLAAAPSGVSAATFLVDATVDAADATPGDGICASAAVQCTLRAAVDEANALLGPDDITVPAGTYTLTEGSLMTTDDVTLVGAGRSCVTGTKVTKEPVLEFDGVDILEVVQGRATVSDICFAGSNVGLYVCVIPDVAAVVNHARLTLQSFEIFGHRGIGLLNESGALAHVVDGTIRNNSGSCLAPGLVESDIVGGVDNRGTLSLHEVVIRDHHPPGQLVSSFSFASGIANRGVLQLTGSYLTNNRRGGAQIDPTVLAGALWNNGRASVANTSFYANDYWDALAIANSPDGVLDLSHVSILEDDTFPRLGNSGTVTVRNSIVLTSCSATITSLGHNIELGTSCGFTQPGDQQNMTTVELGLDSVSGPTPTLTPVSTANVVDLADDVSCPHMDQRRFYRPPGSCDIGAAERNAVATACDNGLDDDGDGFCDALGASCTDGSTPGDPGCADASDPQELDLVPGDVLTADSDAAVKRLDPLGGDVRILSRGLGMFGPVGVAVDANRVFVSDNLAGVGRIFQIDRETGVPWLVGAGGSLVNARGLSLDAQGRLLVGDTTSDLVIRVDPETGDQTVVSTGPPFAGPEYVSEDPTDGTLLVSDYVSSTPQGIYRIDPVDGNVLESWTGSFSDPRQHQLDPDGIHLWVVDSGPNRLFKLDLTAPAGGSNPEEVGIGLGDSWGMVLDPNGVDAIVAARNEGIFWRVPLDGSPRSIINDTDVAHPHEIALLTVPEPGGVLMLVSGVALLLALRGRRSPRGA